MCAPQQNFDGWRSKGPPKTSALQNSVASFRGNEANARKADLFRRHLARRIERAGVVDFGNLLVVEAEHLAEDFVGVLAQ